MKTIDLTGKRDFPLTTNVLEYMQDAYAALEQLTALVGSEFILSGCVDEGASVTSGIIVLRGMIMPFSGGAKDTTIKIVRTVSEITVAEGTRIQRTYHAEFGTTNVSGDQFVWADILKPLTMLQLWSRISAAEWDIGESEHDIVDINDIFEGYNTVVDAVVTSDNATIATNYCKIVVIGKTAHIKAWLTVTGFSGTSINFKFNKNLIGANVGEFVFVDIMPSGRLATTVDSASPFVLESVETPANATFQCHINGHITL